MGPNALSFCSPDDCEDVEIQEEIQIDAKKKPKKSMDDYVVKFTKNEYEEATKFLVNAICTARIPFAFVENIYFKRFVKVLNPCYKLPSRKQVAGPLLEKEYKESKGFMMVLLK